MEKQQVAILLTAIAAVDDRIDPDEARIEAWTAILDSDMTLEFARGLMIKHYANTTKPIMPADFNSPWRTFRERMADKEWFAELEYKRTELPSELKQLLQQTRAKIGLKVDNEKTENQVAENQDSLGIKESPL